MLPNKGSGLGSRTEEISVQDRREKTGELSNETNTSCPQGQYPALRGLRDAGVIFCCSIENIARNAKTKQYTRRRPPPGE